MKDETNETPEPGTELHEQTAEQLAAKAAANAEEKEWIQEQRATLDSAAQRELFEDYPMHAFDINDGRTYYLPSRKPTATLDIGAELKLEGTRRSYEHGYANYACGKCGKALSIGMADTGRTATFMACPQPDRARGGAPCGGQATNIGYTEIPVGNCRSEWFKPNGKLIEFYGKYDPQMWRHCSQGGLAYRPAHFDICCACHQGIERGKGTEWGGGTICTACEADRIIVSPTEKTAPRIKQRRGVRSKPANTPGRNEPCHCGATTGEGDNERPVKFKNCHGR
tara:strand:- start:23270 stop:24115 length:846 start_codon:yes stop_codon:yes gene_type:complete